MKNLDEWMRSYSRKCEVNYLRLNDERRRSRKLNLLDIIVIIKLN